MKPDPIKNLATGWRFVVDVALRWYHGGVGDLAAGVTFWVLVSLPASILALLAVLDQIKQAIDIGFRTEIETTVLNFVNQVFTDENGAVTESVSTLFRQDPDAGLLTVSLLVALWSISRGFAGLIRALDDIYEVENRRAWYYTRVVAILLGAGSMLISIPLVMLDRLVWARMTDGALEEMLRSVVAVGVLVLWASTIYHFGPSLKSRWRHDLFGAVVAAIGWWLLTVGFQWYVELTSGTNEVTAAIGAFLLALTWVWLAAQVLLIGGTVNYLYGQRKNIRRTPRQWWISGRIPLAPIPTLFPGLSDQNSQPDTNGSESRSVPEPTADDVEHSQARPSVTTRGHPPPIPKPHQSKTV